jgi:hypothetical protein
MNLKHLSSGSSKSAALLRGMASKYNSAIQAGGAKVTESNAQAATSQFESSDLVGGTAPTSPTDAAPSGGGASTGGGSTVSPTPYTPTIDNTGCDYESGAYYKDGACVTTNPNLTNATPWQSMVDSCSSLIMIAASLLIIGSILNAWAHSIWSHWLHYVAIALSICAMMMALMVVMDGFQINKMGGSPQGTMFIISAGLLLVGGGIVVGWGEDFGVNPAIACSALGLGAMITSHLK